LDFVVRIGHHLRKAGHHTHYTRPDDNLIPLATRGKAAVARGCDLFLSIHCNAGPASASGVETFVVEGDDRSRKIAVGLVKAVVRQGMKSRGVKWDSYSQHSRLRVLRDACHHMPAVLLEIGFLTNDHDAALIKKKSFREAVAISLSCAIQDSLQK
jgi:N-acetylmuramoyl-L-alanine amidase